MWDVLIVGGGPAGLTAGLYATRGGMETLLFENMYPGGQAATSPFIENYPGIPDGIVGAELGANIERQAKRFGLQVAYETVESVQLEGDVKTVVANGKTYESRTLILCMGAYPRTLAIPGEDRLRGQGISYCATCDGAFYRDRQVAVVGGGDSSVEESLFLAKYCEKVHLIHRRDQLRAGPASQKKILNHPKVEIHWNRIITQYIGEHQLEGLELTDTISGAKERLNVPGLFVAIGKEPNNKLVQGKISLTDLGCIVGDDHMRTEIPGVFVAGDVRAKNLRQVVTAVADGATAGWAAQCFCTGI